NLPSPAPDIVRAYPPKRRWLWLGSGAGVLVTALFFYMKSDAEVDVSDLPVWFDRAHRIERPASAASPVTFVPGVGMLLPPRESDASGTLPKEEFERDFTHYTKIPLFVWATPTGAYPSHGKILPDRTV